MKEAICVQSGLPMEMRVVGSDDVSADVAKAKFTPVQAREREGFFVLSNLLREMGEAFQLSVIGHRYRSLRQITSADTGQFRQNDILDGLP